MGLKNIVGVCVLHWNLISLYLVVTEPSDAFHVGPVDHLADLRLHDVLGRALGVDRGCSVKMNDQTKVVTTLPRGARLSHKIKIESHQKSSHANTGLRR